MKQLVLISIGLFVCTSLGLSGAADNSGVKPVSKQGDSIDVVAAGPALAARGIRRGSRPARDRRAC